MVKQPSLNTPRLLLRPFSMEDDKAILQLMQDKAVAATTLRIPHPCTLSFVQKWLAKGFEGQKTGKMMRWAVCLADNKLAGGISLTLKPEHESAELGYWMGKAFWGKGYTSEAAEKALHFGFIDLGLNRIEAHSMVENIASSRILQKLGMQHEGLHRQLVKKWGSFKDVETFGILRDEYVVRD